MQSCVDMEAQFQTNIPPSPVTPSSNIICAQNTFSFRHFPYVVPLMRFSSTSSHFCLTKHTFSPDWCEDSDSKFQVLFQHYFSTFLPFHFRKWKKILSLFKIAKLRSSGRTRDFYFPCTNSIIAISAILKHIIIHLSYLDLLKLFTSILKMRNCWTTFYNCKSCSSKNVLSWWQWTKVHHTAI